jgi:hypothetical protein
MLNKRTVITISTVLITLLLAGCNGAPTVIMMQITNTPDPRVIQVTVTDTGVPAVKATAAPVSTAGPVASGPSATPEANAPVNATSLSTVAAPVIPTVTAPPPGTPIFPAPTDTRVQLYIAQENFQNGYMFWISSTKEDWVLFPAANTPANQPPTSGEWRIYKDTYLDTEPEFDPAVVPPSSNLYQPRRGFGKLWRTTDNIRAALGWGTTPEFGLTTSYVYQPGGHADPTQTQWIAGPGTHFVITLGRETFAFHEPLPGQQYGTWDKVS